MSMENVISPCRACVSEHGPVCMFICVTHVINVLDIEYYILFYFALPPSKL